ncbi:MAG TPA: hypothetical protein VGD74_01375, partial [Vulgatibacter sp.]
MVYDKSADQLPVSELAQLHFRRSMELAMVALFAGISATTIATLSLPLTDQARMLVIGMSLVMGLVFLGPVAHLWRV